MAKMTIKIEGSAGFVLGLSKMNVDLIGEQGRLEAVLRGIKESAKALVQYEEEKNENH